MGLIRTILALAVLFDHTPLGPLLVGGRNAVQLFYVISGFLISYVLVELDSYRDVRSFYMSRYLRLFPIYIVVALLSMAPSLAANPSFTAVYRDAPAPAVLVLVASNVFIFFQDWVMFLGIEGGRLIPTANFQMSEVPLFKGLLVPQAWTLGVELSFYLVAPFILKSAPRVIVLLAASLILRAALVAVGIGGSDPWTYRFFPNELALFLSGALAHRYLLPTCAALPAKVLATISQTATGLLLLVFVAYPVLPLPEAGKIGLLFGLFILLVPLSFVFQNTRPWDKWIGELSYPLYIGHVLVARAVSFVFGKLAIHDDIAYSVVVVVVSLGFAHALNRFVARPVEAYRIRLRSRQPRAAN